MKLLSMVASRNTQLFEAINVLRDAIVNTVHTTDALTNAMYERNVILPAMQAVRAVVDDLETLVGKDYWPFPTYDDLLFNV